MAPRQTRLSDIPELAKTVLAIDAVMREVRKLRRRGRRTVSKLKQTILE